jgi:predicted RNA-binding protein with PIN domain
MPLLIDGHNLIGKMEGVSLADPDDEAALVQRVRRYCLRHRRRATVVFDSGLPGGPSRTLSSPEVKVIFAPTGSNADALIRHLLRQERDPAGLLVISSDRAIRAAAQARGARAITAEAFARQLTLPARGEAEKPETAGDVEEWLKVFGGE